MANTIYWTPWMEQLQQANNTNGEISETSPWHGKMRKMRLMGKRYSWASWGSVSQRIKYAEQWAGELRKTGISGREHGPAIKSWHSHRIQTGARGQSASQEIVLCPFCCSTGTQGENPPHSVSFWCALPADLSSNNYSCMPLQTLAIYMWKPLVWTYLLAQIKPFASGGFLNC